MLFRYKAQRKGSRQTACHEDPVHWLPGHHKATAFWLGEVGHTDLPWKPSILRPLTLRNEGRWFLSSEERPEEEAVILRKAMVPGARSDCSFSLHSFVFEFLQCCVGFCSTTTWISHNYTYIASLLSQRPTPLGHHESTRLGSPCYRATSHQLSILHMTVHTCWYYFLHLPHSLPSALCPQAHSLHLCLHSSPANRFMYGMEKWYGWTPCTLDRKLLWPHGLFWRCNLCHDWFLPHLPCHSLSN